MPSTVARLLNKPLFAALAVVSAGRPLSAAQRRAFGAAARAAGLEASEVEALERACELGLGAADGVRRALDAAPMPTGEAAWELLAAPTLLALRAAGDLREPLAVSEALARQARLPHDAVAQLAGRLQPLVEALPAGELEAQLAAFLAPGEAELAAARRIGEALTAAAPPKRSAARIPLQAFQVEGDRQGQRLLSDMAGFEDLTRLIFEHGFEKAMRLHNLSSCIRVGPTQFPELHAVYVACVERAGVKPVPELYVCPGGINAHTSGLERPYVMIDAGAISRLSRAELEFLIGHELGHVRCRHLLHWFVVTALPMIAQALPLVGPLLSLGLEAALGEWRRQAELSCDRMGLLVCQDLDAALRVMVKWSGVPAGYDGQLDLEAFLAQAEEFRALDRDALSLVYKFFMTAEKSHPWTVERAALLKAWVDEGGYEAAFARAGSDGPVGLLPLERLAEPAQADPWGEALAGLAAAWRAEGQAGLAAALAALAAADEAPATVLVGASAALEAALAGGAWQVAPAFSAEGPLAWGLALPGAGRVVVGLSAAQLLSAPERQTYLPQVLALAPGAAFAWAVAGCEVFETARDAEEAAERLGAFLRRHGRSDDAIFWLGGAASEATALADWLAAPSAPLPWRARWRGLAALVALGAPAGGEAAEEAARRTAYEATLKQLHGLAIAEAQAVLNARFAALRLELPQRLNGMSEASLRREGFAELEGLVADAGRGAGEAYLAAFERGLMVSAPADLRALVAGFGAAGAALDRALSDGPTGVWVAAERPANLALGALTAVATGLVVLGGPMMAALGGVAFFGAQGLRGTVEEAHSGRLREDAFRRLEGWLDEARAASAARLDAETAALAQALAQRLASEPLLGREATPAQAAWERLTRLAEARLADDAEEGRA